ncbi:hypothetical protein [Aureimonas sp. AU4]|uniref:hypothetical protein n=1 Tax=Aureimonas sp. AU4 TaxID=1638163 RepID=UPI000781A7B7|nr:hypothetical protein [Aureimonas sp. AU4]
MGRIFTTAALALATGLLGVGSTQAEPSAPSGFIFGVGTHYAFPLQRGYTLDATMPLLHELGVDSFRDDVDADYYVDPAPDQPLGTRRDRLGAALLARSAKPVLILRGQTLEREPRPRLAPRTGDERSTFGRFAASVTENTRAFDPIYEIWNEWNMQWRTRPRMGGLLPGTENPDYSPENYVAAARAAYGAVKAADPGAVVLTGSIGEDADWAWTRRALEAGLLETGDGLSVHFYNHCAGAARRTAEDLRERVEDFRRVVVEAGGDGAPPLYITEFGWPNDDGPCGIDRALAASNIAQFTLWSATVDWIRGVWVYELRDGGERPEEREDNFGLYDYANRPKPAACAYREAIALSREIEGGHLRESPDGVRWLEGTGRDGAPIWVFWATARDGEGAVRLPAGAEANVRTVCDDAGARQVSDVVPIVPMPVVVRPNRDLSPDQLVFSAQ